MKPPAHKHIVIVVQILMIEITPGKFLLTGEKLDEIKYYVERVPVFHLSLACCPDIWILRISWKSEEEIWEVRSS